MSRLAAEGQTLLIVFDVTPSEAEMRRAIQQQIGREWDALPNSDMAGMTNGEVLASMRRINSNLRPYFDKQVRSGDLRPSQFEDFKRYNILWQQKLEEERDLYFPKGRSSQDDVRRFESIKNSAFISSNSSGSKAALYIGDGNRYSSRPSTCFTLRFRMSAARVNGDLAADGPTPSWALTNTFPNVIDAREAKFMSLPSAKADAFHDANVAYLRDHQSQNPVFVGRILNGVGQPTDERLYVFSTSSPKTDASPSRGIAYVTKENGVSAKLSVIERVEFSAEYFSESTAPPRE